MNGTLEIVISDVPTGALLGTYDGSDFTEFKDKDDVDGLGTYTLQESDLINLAVKPAENFSGTFDLGLKVSLKMSLGRRKVNLQRIKLP